jgi:DNA-directed RNA polymerase subunit RPC12/RpoP
MANMIEIASDNERAEALSLVSNALGFPIDEKEIPIEHRTNINQLALTIRKRKNILSEIHARSSLSYSIPTILLAVSVTIASVYFYARTGLSLLLGAAIFGIAVVLFAVVWALIDRTNLAHLNAEAAELKGEIEGKAKNIANEVKVYLSSVDRARIRRPIIVNFDQLLSALKNKGIVLEIIDCPNCGGQLSVAEIKKKEEILECKHCGKPILVTNIFEKFKELLS